jgi:MFS family permease
VSVNIAPEKDRTRAAAPASADAASSSPSLRSAFSAFGNPHFRWLWTSTLTSFIGMQMQMVALGILAWDLTGSYTLVGVVQAAFAVPMAVLSLPGGAAVDRVEKRRIVAFSQGAMGLLALSTAALVQAELISVVILFITGMGQGALFSFNGPARMAMLTETVEARALTAAISLQNVAMNGTRIVAPAAAGILIAVIGVAGAYYVAAAMFVFTVFAALQLPRTTAHIGRPRRPLPSEIGEGLRYVFGNHTLRSLMLSGFALVFFVMPYNVLLPGFADGLGRKEYFGLMVAVAGAGGLVGSLGIATLTEHPRKPLLQLAVGLACAVGLVLLGALSQPLGITGALIALAILGATSTSYMTLNQTMLMTEAAPEFHGRVMSIFMQTFSAMPLMALPLGLVADQIGAAALFVLQGVVVAVALLAFALGNRSHTFARAR